MSNVDASWFHMDEPTNLMQVTAVLFVDRPVSLARLRAQVAERLIAFDRLRQRVVDTEVPLTTPAWENDPSFDLDRHVVAATLPPPAGEDELKQAIGQLMSSPLPPDRPLWQFHLIERYRSGAAIIGRIHHCIADGTALTLLTMSLTDAGPDGPAALRLKPSGPPGRNDGHGGGLLRGIVRGVGSSLDRAGRIARGSLEAVTAPHQMIDAAALGGSSLGSFGRLLLMPSDTETVLKGGLGLEKRVAWSAHFPLADVKEIGRCLGGTVNDVLVAAAAGALRRYLRQRDEPLYGSNVRVVVPVNLRPADQAARLGNEFGLVFLSLPTGLVDPFDRFHETKRRMDEIKRSPDAVVTFQMLKAVGLAPRRMTGSIVELFARRATAVMTNVPGPTEPLWIAGGRIERMLFWVPRAGRLGLGLSILSYDGCVSVGIVADANLVPDPEGLARGFDLELGELMRLVTRPREE
jgi:WS/DGAT/MGAT family acyltransferase